MTTIQDVICLVVPVSVDPAIYLGHEDSTVRDAFLEQLTEMACDTVWNQWRGGRIPEAVDFEETEWLVTQQVEMIREFQPAHDCPTCWAGNTKAEAFLRENPGRWIAMGNLTYTPVWA